MTLLHRFWFKFSPIKPYDPSALGYGVTAYTYDDAISILKDTVFQNRDLPEVQSVIEDVDISTLDQKHVIPNMEPPVWRGVWFPKGYLYGRAT
jgi:hypothetical protein